MNSKPLEYESLKAVLKHLDPNKRFEIAMDLPSVGKTERTVPLKIKRLRFSDTAVEVNGLEHRLEVFKSRKSNEEDSIECGRTTPHDIDELGFEELRSAQLKAKDDIQIIYSDVSVNQVDFDQFERELQKKKNELKELKENGMPEMYKQSDMKALEKRIQDLEYILAPFYRQRDNLPLPYSPLIQYTKKLEFSKDKVEKFSYAIKLHEARRNLNAIFFAKRSHPIEIELLQISGSEGHLNIRLPYGIKFVVNNLEFDGDVEKTLDGIAPIIHESSHPIGQIEYSGRGLNGLEHNLIRNAKTLVLNHADSFVQYFIMNHMNLIIEPAWRKGSTSQVIDAIRIWMGEGTPMGKCIKIVFDNDEIPREVLVAIGEQLNGFVSGNRASIPTENFSEVFVEMQAGKRRIFGLMNGGTTIYGHKGYTLLSEGTTVLRGGPRCILEVSTQPRGYLQSLLHS